MQLFEDIPASQSNSCSLPSPLPPQTTWEEAFANARCQAFHGGYGLVKNKKHDHKYWFQCEFFGLPDKKGLKTDVHESKRRKGVGSKKIGCTFCWACIQNKDDGLWYTSLRKTQDGTDCQLHNHYRSDPEGLTSHRTNALPDEVTGYIISQIAIGVPPRNIVACAEKQYKPQYDFTINAKDISNIRQKRKSEMLDGQTSTEWLIEEVRNDGHWSKAKFDSNGHLTHFFCVGRDCLIHWYNNPAVVMADNTHNTQKWGMYLCNFVGMSGGGWAPHLSFGLVSGQSQEDYEWLLEAFEEARKEAPAYCLGALWVGKVIDAPKLFITDRDLAFIKAQRRKQPDTNHILCKWHVNMNVATKTRKHFPVGDKLLHNGRFVYTQNDIHKKFLGDWNLLTGSFTLTVFHDRLEAFKRQWQPNHEMAYKYAMGWLDKWKEKIVRVFIEEYSHFGVFTTSPCEGVHGGIKSSMVNGRGDFVQFYEGMKAYWIRHHKAILVEANKQLIRHPTELSSPFFQAVRRNIHSKALYKTLLERQKLPISNRPPEQPCQCTRMHSEGLPCMHIIYYRLNSGSGRMMVADYHWFWRRGRDIADEPDVPTIKDPRTVQQSGRPSLMESKGLQTAKSGARKGLKNLSKRSTTSNPSAHEYQDPRLLGFSNSQQDPPTHENAIRKAVSPPLVVPIHRTEENSTDLVMARFEDDSVDLYEPGTREPRVSRRSIANNDLGGIPDDGDFDWNYFIDALDDFFVHEDQTSEQPSDV